MVLSREWIYVLRRAQSINPLYALRRAQSINPLTTQTTSGIQKQLLKEFCYTIPKPTIVHGWNRKLHRLYTDVWCHPH